MAVITISRGSYSHGKEIAEKVAQRLGYACISRDLLLESSEEFNIPEIMLTKALENAPSFLERYTHGKEKYIAFIEAKLLEHAQKDNMVYHGLAGHLFLREVQHVLKVRIIANMDARAQLVMAREKTTKEKALQLLKKVDEERRRWGLDLYGFEPADPSLYNLVINVEPITVDDAADIICHASELERFKATPESQRALDNLALAAKTKAKLVPVIHDVAVTASNGTVFVQASTNIEAESQVVSEIKEISEKIPGVTDVKIDIALLTPRFL